MITLQELREMILEVLDDNKVHTRQELITYAKEKYEMSFYDADQRTTSAIKSLIKKGDMNKLEKGVYQLQSCDELTEDNEEILQNQSKIYSDMPNCVRSLSALETELGGKTGSFAEWLRTVYELNEDFNETPAEATKKLCVAFQEVKRNYGADIACTLYNTQTIVLPTELMPAAMYLHCGGDIDSAKPLASNGFFMESYSFDCMKQAVQFIAEGGAADEVYAFLSQNKKEDLLQGESSAMSMMQSL